MKNLFNFLKRFRNFLLFFFLQIFILGLYFNSKNYHKSAFINTSSGVSGWVLEKRYNIYKHFTLEESIDSIAKVNAKLLAQHPKSFYKLQDRIYYINDSIYEQQYEYKPATVINSTTNKRNNYITINKGSILGIEKGMGVISDNGVVGFVIDVSNHYAIIKTILSDKVNISANIKEQKEVVGQIKWDGNDSEVCQLHGITSDIVLNGGETILTKGTSGVFPEGIVVGKIKNDFENNGSLTLKINVNLGVNFSQLHTVYLIKNILKTEQKSIEQNYFNE